MPMTKGEKIQAAGAVGSLASSFIATWGAYSTNKIAAKSATRLAKLRAESAAQLATISNLRIDIQTDLDLYFQAEQFESARREVLDKNLQVQTAVLQAKGAASAAAAFSGVHGSTTDIEANLIDIQGARAEGQVELEMEALTRQNALAVGNTLLSGSRQKQTTTYIPAKQQGPSGVLAVGSAVADISRVYRHLQEKT